MKHLILLLFFALGCKNQQSTSDPDFLLLNYGGGGLIRYINQAELSICTNDMSRAQDIEAVVRAWISLARGVARPRVVEGNSGNCQATVSFQSLPASSPSYTQTSAGRANIVMNSGSQWFNFTPVLMHEFGHAFGLADTYSPTERKNGVCISGQPREAIMCTISLGVPQADDQAGIEAVKAAVGITGSGPGPGIDSGDNFSQQRPNNTQQTPPGTQVPYNRHYNPLANREPIYGNQFSSLSGKPILPLVIAAILIAATEGMSLSEADPNPRFDVNKCDEQVKVFIVVDKSLSQHSPRLGIVAAFTTANITACIGGLETCGLPHTPRYLGNRVVSENREWFVSEPLSFEDKKQLMHQNKILEPGLVTVEGLHFPAGLREPPKPFRCIAKAALRS
jgi:hypothetical protein